MIKLHHFPFVDVCSIRRLFPGGFSERERSFLLYVLCFRQLRLHMQMKELSTRFLHNQRSRQEHIFIFSFQVCIFLNYKFTFKKRILAVFTLEDKQIVSDEQMVWCASDVQTGRTNFSTNKSSDSCRSGKTIFRWRFVRWDKQVDDSTT